MKTLCCYLVLAASLLVVPHDAQWPTNPETPTPLTPNWADQSKIGMVTTSRGTWVAWHDRRQLDTTCCSDLTQPGCCVGGTIRYQRFDPQGRPAFPLGGNTVVERDLVVQPNGSITPSFAALADIEGDAVILYHADGTPGVVRLVRIGDDGSTPWGATGVGVFLGNSASAIRLRRVGNKLHLIWRDTVLEQQWLLVLDADGTIFNPPAEIPLPSSTAANVRLLTNPATSWSYLVTFVEDSAPDIGTWYAQAFGSNGDSLYPLGWEAISSGAWQPFVRFAVDDWGGLIIAHADADFDNIVLQRINLQGSLTYQPGGSTVVTQGAGSTAINYWFQDFDLQAIPDSGACEVAWCEVLLVPGPTWFHYVKLQRFTPQGLPVTPGVARDVVLPVAGGDRRLESLHTTEEGSQVIWAENIAFARAAFVPADNVSPTVDSGVLNDLAPFAARSYADAAFGDVLLLGRDSTSELLNIRNFKPSGLPGPEHGTVRRFAEGNQNNALRGEVGGLGETAEIRLAITGTGHDAGLVLGYLQPANIFLPQLGGTALVSPTTAEVFGFPLSTDPEAVFTVDVPNDPSLSGFRVYSQGVLFEIGQPLELTNALDLYLAE